MDNSPYIGLANRVEIADSIISDEGSDFTFSKNRFVEVVAVLDAPVSTFELIIHWNGDEKVLSSFAPYGHNGSKSTLPTQRIELFDNQVPASGIKVADSGVLPMSPGYEVESSFGIEDVPEQDLYTFTEQIGDRLVPRTIPSKSIRWTFATTGSFLWEIGYLWASESIALSDAARLGAVDSPTAVSSARQVKTKGAGIARQDDRNIGNSLLEFPVLNALDQVTLVDLYRRVGFDTPFFFQRDPQQVQQRDRVNEGGIVRFTGKDLKLTRRGAGFDGRDLYQMVPVGLAVWR